ncbi:transglycosylase domain-containing protein [Macrococcus armenti]|uniref:transglycosylase domain-containing protein n=1 Tax=Macrococcus armenti TaxID=2875764 RepID=UPI001CCE5604|nr:transglycosylase domain-containing protein [Macrococcus armenti]UBH14690.1 penicillin-binding protein [Macrococcus armenti]UBH17049.1 penicillin-binding protein [Macrococcus armenti]UBH19315.1 penicillin-binding protein [Macrococcus armenti]
MADKTSYKDKLNHLLKRYKSGFKSIKYTPYVIFNGLYETITKTTLFIITACILIATLILGIGSGYFLALVKDEPVKSNSELKKSLYEMTESTTVYFGTGETLGNLNADTQRDVIKLKDMSPHVIDALIATEDENFYNHKGIVPKAFLRATAQEFLNLGPSSGGSTLTQQLIKNQLLTNETSFQRKAKEMMLSFKVEKSLTKDEIIEAYLNVVSFGRNTNGQNIAGIEAAAQGIFGIKAKDLNISQAAFIAGLPQNPYTYTPFLQDGSLKSKDDLSYGFTRQKYVLSRMYQENKISKAEYEKAKAFNLTKSFAKDVETPNENYPFLVQEVEDEAINILKYHFASKDNISKSELDDTPVLQEKYKGIAERAVRNDGYIVETTINKPIFDAMNAVKDNPNYYSYDRQVNVNSKMETLQQEVGVLLKENKTGKIIAFVGGRDHEKSQNNHAMKTKRSPGSTIKPLLTYAPAMEYGMTTPETMLLDKKFDYNGYSPENYARMEYGNVTTRYALENSLNLSTLRLYSGIQDKKPWELLNKMNFNIPSNEQENLSLALGATDITLKNNVDGFSTLANNGNYQESYMIERIKTKDGKVLYQHEAKPERIYSDATAYMTTDILRGVLDTGSAYILKGAFLYNQDWAGKTGTTQDAKDSLFVAYNPKVTMGIWMGYDVPTTFDEENHYQLKLWRDIVNQISSVDQNQMGVGEQFSVPSSVSKQSICQFTMSTSGCASGESMKESLVSKKSDLSSKSLDDHRVLARLGINIDSATRSKIFTKAPTAAKKDKKKKPN